MANQIYFYVFWAISLYPLYSLAAEIWESSDVFLVTKYEVRFQASLRQKNIEKLRGFGSGHICTGALFAYDRVVVPAYCIHTILGEEFVSLPPTEFHVVLGTLSLLDKENAVIRDVESYLTHPGFDGLSSNVAILLFDKLVEFDNPLIAPIKISSSKYDGPYRAIIIGWNVMPVGKVNKKLMAVRAEIMSMSTCRKSRKINSFHSVNQGMMCIKLASETNNITCISESGGLLLADNYLVGISTWALGCGTHKSPILYSSLTNFYDWADTVYEDRFSYKMSKAYSMVCDVGFKFKILLLLRFFWPAISI